MVEIEIGKREHNKVVMKQNILQAFIGAMEEKSLHEINIEEVCTNINISKVTFFNYFSSKEEVVDYFIQLWQFEISHDLGEYGLKGRQALDYLFDNVASHPSVNSIMAALTVYFAKVECYKATHVSDYELYMYHRSAFEKGYRSTPLYQIFNKAVDDLGVRKDQGHVIITNIMSGFYGIPLVARLGFGKDLKQMYRDFLDSLLD